MSKTIQKQSKEEKGVVKKMDFDLGARVSERVQIHDVFMIGSNTNQLPEASSSELAFNISQKATTNLQENNVVTVLASYKFRTPDLRENRVSPNQPPGDGNSGVPRLNFRINSVPGYLYSTSFKCCSKCSMARLCLASAV